MAAELIVAPEAAQDMAEACGWLEWDTVVKRQPRAIPFLE